MGAKLLLILLISKYLPSFSLKTDKNHPILTFFPASFCLFGKNIYICLATIPLFSYCTDMNMKRPFSVKNFPVLFLLLVAAIFLMPGSADAQNRNVRKSTKTTRTRTTSTVRQTPVLRTPVSPTPIDVRERTIKDLLYFPYGCLPGNIRSPEEAQERLTEAFGSYEKVNNIYEGLHFCDTYDYTYRGVPIGLCFADWHNDNRQWFLFYFDSKAAADRFYTNIVSDIKNAGIPLTTDKIYGGMSNRTRPVSIFKWVSVAPPVKVKEADESNINHADVVGMYVVELGVYKRKVQ